MSFEVLKEEIKNLGNWNISYNNLRFEEAVEETRSVYNQFIKDHGGTFVQHLLNEWKIQVGKYLFVFDMNELAEPIGIIGVTRSRHCFSDPQFVITSIIIKPQKRRMGYGRRILALTLELIEDNNIIPKAVIREDNKSSLNLFKSFEFKIERACYLHNKKHYILTLF